MYYNIIQFEVVIVLIDHCVLLEINQEKLENQEGKSANEKDLLHKCGEKCKGATKESTVRKSKEGHDHMIPTFHEDYYGPRGHNPKHH